MNRSKKEEETFLVSTDEYGEVFFPWYGYPFFRGYLVPSKPMRDVIVKRMDFLDTLNILMLAVAILIGWPLDSIGFFLSLWLVGIEVLYWLGTRRLTRRMASLPLSLSFHLETQKINTDDLPGLALAGVVLGLVVLLYAWLGRDLGWLIFGSFLIIRSLSLSLIMGARLIYRFRKRYRPNC